MEFTFGVLFACFIGVALGYARGHSQGRQAVMRELKEGMDAFRGIGLKP